MIRETAALTLSQVLGRLLYLAFWVAFGNAVGVEITGVFANMNTLLSILVIVSTFGMDLWLARHAANHELSRRGFWLVNGLKTLLALAGMGLLWLGLRTGVIGAVLEGYHLELWLFMLSLLLDNIGFTCGSVFEGKRALRSYAVMVLIRWFSLALWGLVYLAFRADLTAAVSAFLVSAGARAAIGYYLVRPHLTQEVKATFNARAVLAGSAPMALLNFLVVLYFHVDMVMLPEYAGEREAGWYKGAYLLVEALLFVSGAVASALFGLFSKSDLAVESKLEQLAGGMRLLLLLAFPIAWGTGVIADDLFRLIFYKRPEEFEASGLALTILVWALPAMFLNSNLVRFLLGLEKQRLVLVFGAATALMNVILNLIFIPLYGFKGAAGATVASETALLIMGIVYIKRHIGTFPVARLFLQPLLAGLVVLPVAWLAARMHPLTAVPAAAAVYGLVLWKGKLLTKEHLLGFGILKS